MMKIHLVKGTLVAMLIALFSLGCSPSTSSNGASNKGKEEHEHPEKGPHGGPLAEWGDEEFHVELVLSTENKQATVYVLDGHAEKAVPIEAETVTLILKSEEPPVQVELKAEPQEGDPAGKASKFVGTHEKLGAKLDPEKIVASGKVKGKPYQGHFHVPGEHDEE